MFFAFYIIFTHLSGMLCFGKEGVSMSDVILVVEWETRNVQSR